ncbi:tryptophan 7-halogenase [Micromonospora sp. WMMA1998]|uniref:NAD(P)/FAD-dependent oxidoreductase n=1 Tax=Micromonospora sp. WMMA1998 TaxID=3015167 RepID=UPI00248B9781|nr:tryptophan 7-halogenase [Micromonospora sp. WMMA1998]WBC14936.1 tryptophan 7-halogenase [Micromonospora sp. WMMA1998]
MSSNQSSTSAPSAAASGWATLEDRCDVAILGGGITGLTLARQLRRALPDLRIVVAERQQHPVPEAAHKVGESSVEVQAHYLREVLGLQEHLDTEQLHKFGLRMFFSHAGNTDIASRVEYGQIKPAPLPSYQLDRGRLENHLGTLVGEAGVVFLTGCRVEQVTLRPQEETHLVRLTRDGASREIAARWVVDATGRSGLLKRQLGLAKPIAHHANASWFRIAHPIDIDEWSTDEAWRSRVVNGDRRLSTNHLMGDGYWVWMIPLSSESISIGIVADATAHSFDGFNRFERALDWLREHEPQLAQEVDKHQDKVQDFRVMKDYAYGCEQVYSGDRWCLTGEAGVSIDPLYSSGGDLMAISNGLITDLIERDRCGEDIAELAVAHNQVYLVLADVWLVAYAGQYQVMGNPQVMVAKVIWDTIIYWAVPGLLFFHDKFRRLGASPQAFQNLLRTWHLHARVQQFFREWHAIDNPPAADQFADPYSLLEFIVDLHNGMAAELPDDELERQFSRNVRLLEQVSGQLVSTVIDRLAPQALADPATAAQLDAWRDEEFLTDLVSVYRDEDPANPIDPSWITLGHHDRERQEVA